MQTEHESSTLDRGLAEANAELHARGRPVPGLDARLGKINASHSIDKFHVLQGLEDPELENGPERYFCFQRWGVTGWRGASQLDGPTTLPKVEARIAKVFEEKTGEKWGSVEPGHDAKPGKYWLQHFVKPETEARWEYFVGDGVDRKAEGWYPYFADAATEVEELYAQHVANDCNKRTAKRVIQSGLFSYEVDLEQMKQRNMKTSTLRDIRRVFGPTAARRGAGRAPMAAMKAPLKAARKAVRKAPVRKVAVKKMPIMKKATKKVMKGMKKVMEASTIATGSRRKHAVFSGQKKRTVGGLKAEDFKRNKKGRIVWVKRSVLQMGNPWCAAVVAARAEMGISGFQPVGGKSDLGKRLYERAKALAGKVAVKKMPMMKKAMKKVKKASTIATGKRRKYAVFSGKKERTSGGLKAEDFKRNKKGQIVWVKRSELQKGNPWCTAVVAARAEMGISGFQPVGGKSDLGKRLYERAKELWLAAKAAKLPEATIVVEEGPTAE